MILVDLICVLTLVVACVIGVRRGLVASAGTLIGLVVGGLLAVWLVPLLGSGLAAILDSPLLRAAISAASVVSLVLVFGALGSAVGRAARRGVRRIRLSVVDRVLGGAVTVVATALVLLLVAQPVAALAPPAVSSAVASSRVLGWLDAATPAYVDSALADVGTLAIDEGLPRLGELLDVQTATTAPPVALDDPTLQAAAQSVARISGTAYACGVGLTGSGFVVGDGLIATNAHVVAGLDSALVELPGREAREGRIVYFDAVDDLAFIAVDAANAVPLALTDALAPGDAAVVQGYPRGGPFTSTNAAVLSSGVAAIPDIYDGSSSSRQIFALAADVQPGNSGGPLLTATGEVAGIVFARGAEDAGRGYAMAASEIRPALGGVTAATPSVSTGACIR